MTSFSWQKQLLGFFFWLVLSFAVSFIGALASFQAQSFYGLLSQPSWAPPPWLFGPVWTLLYTMMATSAWLVWRNGGFAKQARPLTLYLAQLAFNAIWSWLFFAWQLGAWAFADIIVLWFLILLTILSFWRSSRVAGLLLIPYLGWVSFAAVLNYSLWQLNPQLL
jgi:tryptophan-rich sensory protein